jgi:hypothetical protein
MNFSNTLFRCSSIGHIMVEAKNKAEKERGDLSETCKTHLIDVFVANKYNRQTDIQNKYVQKGLMVEEDSITLYSRLKKNFFKKNIEHLKNEFIQGTPDLFVGNDIYKASIIIDIKSSWDIFTFLRNYTKDINTQYYWQLQGYMALTSAKEAILAYCLIDTPEVLIDDEKRKLFYKMNAGTELNEDYIQACEDLEKNMKFSDIPIKNRVIEFKIERNDDAIERMYQRVIKCREYLNELEAKLNPVFIAEYDKETMATIIQ